MKKFLVALFCAALMGAPAFAMTREEEDAAWKKEPAYGRVIRIGYNGGLCLGTFGIAQLKGFYAAEGLQTEVVRMAGGGTAQIDAVGTGKVEVTGDHIATLLVPTVNGVRMKFTTGVHSGCKSLYVPSDSPVKTTADLIGKYVAIPDGIGGSDQNISMRFFHHDHIDPRQIKWKVAEAGVAVMAMKKGEVQAALLGDQFAKRFLDSGELRIIRSLTFDEDFKQEPCCVHAVNLDFYNENPITVKKLTRAHEAASAWVMEHPEEAVAVLQANKWAAGDPKLVLEIFKTYDYSISDEATETALRNIIDDYKTFGMIDSAKDTEDLLKRVWDPVLGND
ncbi:MAG: ABC transporter substrate-binding protein [Pyramidobacter sp.]|uniref:ABC transporter substrate-binding protein n=1 Tax=Pyramidobacter sp. TaxID=1943581 RepID=UPI002A81FD5B|nr:ABC transporter substrate-binding protein [Pyramidobacter sp.]MDY4033216.1 ABC transporter substrate-binding protein [Pyramidobacter sp.]